MHQEVFAPHQLALPYEEDLDPGVARFLRQRYHVHVFVGQLKHLLALVDLFDSLNLVAQRGGALELQRLGRLYHPRLDAAHDLVGLALEEHRHLVYDLVVVGAVHLADARAGAAVYEVVEAGAVVVAGNRLGAGAVGEQLLEQRERLADAGGAGERAKVPGAVPSRTRRVT